MMLRVNLNDAAPSPVATIVDGPTRARHFYVDPSAIATRTMLNISILEQWRAASFDPCHRPALPFSLTTVNSL
jgi:hypothetical protein